MKELYSMKIGLLSDTHGKLDEQLFNFFRDCDEIWHAGDIGSIEVLLKLRDFKPVIAVFGNVDNHEIRSECKEHQRHNKAGLDIWMTHIGGYPGNYDRRIRELIRNQPPGLFISGHSHILKVVPDKKLGLLHINPGAAGYHGLHQVRTAVRFSIRESHVADLEMIELGNRSALS